MSPVVHSRDTVSPSSASCRQPRLLAPRPDVDSNRPRRSRAVALETVPQPRVEPELWPRDDTDVAAAHSSVANTGPPSAPQPVSPQAPPEAGDPDKWLPEDHNASRRDLQWGSYWRDIRKHWENDAFHGRPTSYDILVDWLEHAGYDMLKSASPRWWPDEFPCSRSGMSRRDAALRYAEVWMYRHYCPTARSRAAILGKINVTVAKCSSLCAWLRHAAESTKQLTYYDDDSAQTLIVHNPYLFVRQMLPHFDRIAAVMGEAPPHDPLNGSGVEQGDNIPSYSVVEDRDWDWGRRSCRTKHRGVPVVREDAVDDWRRPATSSTRPATSSTRVATSSTQVATSSTQPAEGAGDTVDGARLPRPALTNITTHTNRPGTSGPSRGGTRGTKREPISLADKPTKRPRGREEEERQKRVLKTLLDKGGRRLVRDFTEYVDLITNLVAFSALDEAKEMTRGMYTSSPGSFDPLFEDLIHPSDFDLRIY